MEGDRSEIDRILRDYRVVAVVGASADAQKPSHRVAKFLKTQGYRIIPVTPQADEVLGEKAYPDLRSIPDPVDIVDIFRRADDIMPVVEDAIAVKARVVWMQEGIVNQQAAARARDAGLTVIMDRCMKKEVTRRLRAF